MPPRATIGEMEEFEGFDRWDERNPATRDSFRRQVWLQIYLPLFLGILILGLAAAGLWRGAVAGTSAWADASLILLLLPVMVVSLIPLVLLAALIYLVTLALQRLPAPAYRVQQALAEVQRRARRGGQLAAAPMVQSKAAIGALQSGIHHLTSIFRRGG